MKSNLLILAHAFPPENISGAARPYRFYRYLPEYGVSPVVITASAQRDKQINVHFVRDVPRDYPRQTLTWHIERLVRKLLLPGALGLTWSRHAALRAQKLVPAPERTVVFSTSPPLSTHLAAAQIKKKLGIPWIADFRDPLNPASSPAGRKTNIYSLLEAYIVRHADALIANTDAMLKLWCDQYPDQRQKFHVIWNGFDPSDSVTPAAIPPRPYKHLVHLGELYDGRHPAPILSSIQRLVANGGIAQNSLHLSLIGPSSDEAIPNIEILRQLIDIGIVEYIPTLIPRDEARCIACTADALLLLQPQSAVQVPAKLFEYIRVGRPILAYIKRNSPVEYILNNSGIPHQCIYPDDSQQDVDSKLLAFLTLSNNATAHSQWFSEQFNARRQSQALARIVESLISVRQK